MVGRGSIAIKSLSKPHVSARPTIALNHSASSTAFCSGAICSIKCNGNFQLSQARNVSLRFNCGTVFRPAVLYSQSNTKNNFAKPTSNVHKGVARGGQGANETQP